MHTLQRHGHKTRNKHALQTEINTLVDSIFNVCRSRITTIVHQDQNHLTTQKQQPQNKLDLRQETEVI